MLIRKDEKPEQTILNIKTILQNVGIRTQIVGEHGYENHFFSVRIEIVGLPGIGTNGKGITREFSLASAYSEFMERLCNGHLLRPYFHYKFPAQQNPTYDPKVLADLTGEYFDYDCSANELSAFFNKNTQYTQINPYKNIMTNQTVFLPDELIAFINGSNGLCAGNTYFEAVTQGIFEICERYVLKHLYTNIEKNSTFGIVSPRKYMHLPIGSTIEEINKKGYHIQVRDFTLNGKLPVIGVIMMDAKYTKFKYALGADFDLNIAIQRCITELFQGSSFDSLFRIQMNPIMTPESIGKTPYEVNDAETSFYKSLIDWSGYLPISAFNHAYTDNVSLIPFIEKPLNNEDAYYALTALFKDMGSDIFIQDNSFLGYPVYRIYVKNMSEINKISSLIDRDTLFAQCYDLKDKFDNADSYRDLYEILQKLNLIKRYNNNVGIKNIFGLVLRANDTLPYDDNGSALLALLALRNKNYNDAYKYFQEFVKSNAFSTPEKEMLDFIYSMKQGWLVEDYFIYTDSFRQNSKNIKTFLSNREFIYPSCPVCAICKMRPHCCFEAFEKVKDILHSARDETRAMG